MFKNKRRDYWGIKASVREIFNNNRPQIKKADYHPSLSKDNDLIFDAFFYQFVPDIWKTSKESVIRHKKEIENLIISGTYREGYIWIKRGKNLKCGALTPDLISNIKSVELPDYLEIEQEKTKWQQNPNYRKEEGFSDPLEEELIQLRFIKK